MTEEERQLTLRWIACWRRAGPELERIREEEIRATDTVRGIRVFEGLVVRALAQSPAKGESGLVDQQRWFQGLRP